jgi:hypothetical protein
MRFTMIADVWREWEAEEMGNSVWKERYRTEVLVV